MTASAGIMSVIAGPLPTGRRRAIEQVLRTTAPMHEGFAGGAFVDTSGAVIGVTTAAEIRGLGVVIPASIAWPAAAHILEHGRLKRGYLGIAGQTVPLPEAQSAKAGRSEALLVVGVTDGSPAAASGVLVGDVLFELGGRSVGSTDDLLELLGAIDVGRPSHRARAARLDGHRPRDHDRRTPGELMRVLIVGSADARQRLRARLHESIEIVAEFATVSAARASGAAADAILVAAIGPSREMCRP